MSMSESRYESALGSSKMVASSNPLRLLSTKYSASRESLLSFDSDHGSGIDQGSFLNMEWTKCFSLPEDTLLLDPVQILTRSVPTPQPDLSHDSEPKLSLSSLVDPSSRSERTVGGNKKLQANGAAEISTPVLSDRDFLPYLDLMISNILVLGVSLGIGDFTEGVLSNPERSDSKCLQVVREWLRLTQEPTWSVFCEQLKDADCFKHLVHEIGCNHCTELAPHHGVQTPVISGPAPHGSREEFWMEQDENVHQEDSALNSWLKQYEKVIQEQGHESVLLDKCFIPFGIKTVQIDQFGGVYCLEPMTDGVEDPHSDDSEQQRSDDDNGDDGDDDDDIDDDDDDEGTGSHRKSRDIGVGREEENRFKIEVPDGALKQESLEVRSAIIFSGPWRLPEGYTLANPVLYISFDCTAVTKPIIVRVPHWIAQVSSLSAVDCPLAIAPHDLPEDASKYSFSFLDQENCSVGARYSTIKLSGHCCLLTQLAIKELESKGQVRYSATAWTRRGQPFDSLSGFTFRVPVIFDLPIWDRVLEKYFKVNKWTRHDCFPPIDFEFHPPNQASLSGSLTEKSGPGWEASLNREMLPQSCVRCEEQALEYKLKRDAYPPSFTITVDYVWSDCEQYSGSQKINKVVSLVLSGTDSGSITFSFKVKEAVYLSETGSLPSLRSPSTAPRNGSPMEACKRSPANTSPSVSKRQPPDSVPTAPMARMEDKIDSSLDICGVEEYNKGLIGDMKMLGAVLGIVAETKVIISRNDTIDSQLLEILERYIANESPTWRDFCTALKRYYGFNNVREKIERDHNSGT